MRGRLAGLPSGASRALLVTLALVGCGGSAAQGPQGAVEPASEARAESPLVRQAAPLEESPAPAAQSAATIERAPSDDDVPRLTVKNDFPISQHVFVDWVHQGELAPQGTRTFELSPGTHTITCSDSSDPDRNPLAVTESFEVGFAYTYVIVAR